MDKVVRIFASCLLLLLIVHTCRAATGIILATEHIDHPNKCWDEDQKTAYDIGEQWQGKGCVAYECSRNKAGLYIHIVSCGVVSIADDSSCTLEEDLSLPYPYCCPEPVCL